MNTLFRYDLRKIKMRVNQFPEDLTARKVYLSLLKFYEGSERVTLWHAMTYEKWALSCGEIGLASLQEVEEYAFLYFLDR